jgi:hypothetical protein
MANFSSIIDFSLDQSISSPSFRFRMFIVLWLSYCGDTRISCVTSSLFQSALRRRISKVVSYMISSPENDAGPIYKPVDSSPDSLDPPIFSLELSIFLDVELVSFVLFW